MKPMDMSIIPEIRYDSAGNPTGVFLTMEEWAILTPAVQPLLTEEQRNESLRRLQEYFASPQSAMEAGEFFDRLEIDDNR